MSSLAEGKAASFTDDAFNFIARYAHEHFGLHLTLAKKEMVFSRLTRRLRQLGMNDFNQYLTVLKGPFEATERPHLLSAITTNITQFFRESHHFDILRSNVLPPLLQAARAGKKIRLWSAGCSAGQEAYSIAMEVLSLCPEAGNLNIKILATDIDQDILQRAQIGTYTRQEAQNIPSEYGHFFAPHPSDSELVTAKNNLKAIIQFAELNLNADWPISGRFDVIFCRNVAIYFDAATQTRLWGRLSAHLTDEGFLFIGHSERVTQAAELGLKGVGVTAYSKDKTAERHYTSESRKK